MKIDVNKLITNMDLEGFSFYQSPLYKPFIDCYLQSNIKCKYKLFQAYIFQFEKLSDFFVNRCYVDDSYLKNGKPNLKLKKVRDTFIKENTVYFIGLTHKLNALFIRVSESSYLDGKNVLYEEVGFMQGNVIQDINDPYAYLTSDCKKLNFQLKNLQIMHPPKTEYSYITKKYETTPIWELSINTKKFIEKRK